MLGKAKSLKFDKVDTFYGSYSRADSIHLHLAAWVTTNPDVTIIDIQYRTYNATGSDGNISWGETALITYSD